MLIIGTDKKPCRPPARFECQNSSWRGEGGAETEPAGVNCKSSLASKGVCDAFMIERKSNETTSTGRPTGEREMIGRSVSVSLLSNGLIKAVFTNGISQ